MCIRDRHYLWNAKLYPAKSTQKEAVQASLVLAKILAGAATSDEVQSWKQETRYSLQESFLLGNTTCFIKWENELENQILVEKFLERLFAGEHYIPALKLFGEKEINERQFEILMEKAERMEFSQKIRVLYAISRSMKYQSAVFHGCLLYTSRCV